MKMWVLDNGKIVMEDRKFLTIDKNKVYYECEMIADRLGMLKGDIK